MKCDYVHIEEARVYGVKNPKFFVTGSVMDKNATFKILADGKEIEYHKLPNLANCGFCLEAELTNDGRDRHRKHRPAPSATAANRPAPCAPAR